MPCTYFRNSQHVLQTHRHREWTGPYPIGAQLNGIAVVGYAKSGMCNSSTNVTVILYDQEVRDRIVGQALLSGYEQERRFGTTKRATDSSYDTGCSCTTVALSAPIFE